MRFKEAYEDWHAGELTQIEAARLLGMCDRSFRRYLARYDEWDMQGLIDKRIEQISHRRAAVDEVLKLVALYNGQYEGWNVRHFHSWYRREHQGGRSYTWVKNGLQAAGAVAKWIRGRICSPRYSSRWAKILAGSPGTVASRLRALEKSERSALFQNTPFGFLLRDRVRG